VKQLLTQLGSLTKCIGALLIISAFALAMVVAGCGECKAAPAEKGTAVQASATAVPTPDPLKPEPTDQLPDNLGVDTTIAKDPITGEITVRVNGGPGMSMLNSVAVQVTNADGRNHTAGIDEPRAGSEVTLPGSKTGNDRVEVEKTYKNGQTYRTDDVLLKGRDLSSAGGSSSGGGC
jgi:hypothetical protein